MDWKSSTANENYIKVAKILLVLNKLIGSCGLKNYPENHSAG